MSRRVFKALALACAWLCLAPRVAGAQPTPAPPATAAPTPSRMWIVVGGASTSLLGDCTGCEADTYEHSGGVTAGAGIALNRRTDFGGEVLFVPATLPSGDPIRITFLMASVQFRPWLTQGFFVKTASGMAFLRNWLNTVEPDAPSVRSKAFGLELAAGWEFRPSGRMGVQFFGAHHVAALGDLVTSDRTVENVVGNFWSVGAAVVFR